jgi:hypothetical protein
LKEDGTCSKCPDDKTGKGLKCYDKIDKCGNQINNICEYCSNTDYALNEERTQCIILQTKIENCIAQIANKCGKCFIGYKPSTDQKECVACESEKDENFESCLYIENCNNNYYVVSKPRKTTVACHGCISNEYYLTASKLHVMIAEKVNIN